MLEIIIGYVLAKNIGNIVAAKGHRRFGYQLMLVTLWIGGWITGAVFGSLRQQVITDAAAQEGSGFPWLCYFCALAGATFGAFIAFAIANSLKPVENDEEVYEIDEGRRDDEVRRAWRAAEDKPLTEGDQIQERPATRRGENRIKE